MAKKVAQKPVVTTVPATEYDNTNRGVLFENDKQGNPKRPDFKGSFVDGDGNEFWCSAWKQMSKSGKKFISFTIEPKEESHETPTAPNGAAW